jgi:hypothetical protein
VPRRVATNGDGEAAQDGQDAREQDAEERPVVLQLMAGGDAAELAHLGRAHLASRAGQPEVDEGDAGEQDQEVHRQHRVPVLAVLGVGGVGALREPERQQVQRPDHCEREQGQPGTGDPHQ